MTNSIFTDRLEWLAVDGSLDRQGFIRAYCADGDGFVSVEQYADDYFTVLEQGEPIATFTTIGDAIARAEQYIAENYPHMFEDSMDWNNPITREDVNAFMGHGHLDN